MIFAPDGVEGAHGLALALRKHEYILDITEWSDVVGSRLLFQKAAGVPPHRAAVIILSERIVDICNTAEFLQQPAREAHRSQWSSDPSIRVWGGLARTNDT